MSRELIEFFYECDCYKYGEIMSCIGFYMWLHDLEHLKYLFDWEQNYTCEVYKSLR